MSNATITLVQDVEILALERQSVPTDDASDINTVDKISVLLAVNPRQAELLRVADGHGVLSLTMRGSEDEEQVPLMDPVTLNDIIDVDDVTHEMEVYRGTSRSTLSFSGGSVLNRRVTNRGPTNSDDVNRDASPATNPATAAPVFIPVWAPPALLPPSMTMPHAVGMPTQPPTSPAVGAETGDDATSGRAMSDSIRGGSATYHDATHEVLP